MNNLIISLFIVAFSLGILMLFFMKLPKIFSLSKNLSGLDKKTVQEGWLEIEMLMNQGKPSASKAAVITADKLLGFVLEKRGFREGTLGDKLKRAKNIFPNSKIYNQAWEVHKVRNQIVHEVKHELFYSQAKEAIKKYKEVFKELGVL